MGVLPRVGMFVFFVVAAADCQRDVDQRQQREDQRLDEAEQHLQEQEDCRDRRGDVTAVEGQVRQWPRPS